MKVITLNVAYLIHRGVLLYCASAYGAHTPARTRRCEQIGAFNSIASRHVNTMNDHDG